MSLEKGTEKLPYFQSSSPKEGQKEYNDISIQHDSLEFTNQIQQPQPALKNWGRCIVLLFDSHGCPIVVLGPHWPLFVFCFGVLALLSLTVVNLIFRTYQNQVIRAASILISSIQLFSYVIVATRNPGIRNEDLKELNVTHNCNRRPGEPWYCTLCKAAQYPKTKHCEDCQVCIAELDHHCPWTGNCIGKGNLWGFYTFLACLFAFILFSLFVCISVAIRVE